MLDNIADLKARWFDLYPRFAEIRESLLATVVKWEWANGPRYDPRPFYFQRESARGRRLRHEPTGKEVAERNWKCGADADGRIVFDGEIWSWQNFYHYSDDAIEMMILQRNYQMLRGLYHLYYEHGRPTRFIGFMLMGHPGESRVDAHRVWQQGLDGTLQFSIEREDYYYSGNQLTRIKAARWHDYRYVNIEPKTWNLEYRLDYSTNGILQQITLDDRTIYRKRKPGETLGTLAEAAKSRLVAVIPDVIKKANFTEPLYCLKVEYFNEDFFPPTLKPGLESWRKHVRATETEYVRNIIWVDVREFDDDEPYPPYPIEDEDALSACERLQLEIGPPGHYLRIPLAVRILRQVAQELNKLDWSNYAPVTPDFIVFANDQEDIVSSLRYSGATRKQIATWRKRGFL